MSDEMNAEVLAIFREEALDLLQRMLATLNHAANAEGAQRAKQVTEMCRLLHTLKGAAAAVSADAIKDAAHALEDQIGALPANAPAVAFDAIFGTLEQLENRFSELAAPQPELRPWTLMEKAAARPPEALAPAAPRTQHAPAATIEAQRPLAHSAQAQLTPAADNTQVNAFTEWLRVPPERVDQLNAHMSELVLARLQQDEIVDRMVHLRDNAGQAMTKQRELMRLLSELRAELSPESWRRLRVSAQSMTHGLSGLLGGLLNVCRDARVLQTQSTIVSQGVEESIQGLRLMPLTPFFETFGKTARDAARRADKRIRFEVRADGAEVDRAVLTRLQDALLHLVRNAVVHGIEDPAERLAQRKPAEGQITLEAFSQGSKAVVRVIDDGAGVDAERVRRKAQALGIADSDDVLELLTHPGLSTKDEADDLAGRGVGLDVVASIVRSLDGTLQLTSERGSGTTFTIRVPIAASTTMGLILTAASQSFGVMMSDVERVVRTTPDEIFSVEGKPSLKIGDDMVALVSLANLLGIDRAERFDTRIPAVVLQQGRRRLAVAVSEIPGEHALVVRPFGHAFRGTDLFIGGAVQPDHSVVPVLSTAALFARAMRASTANLSSLSSDALRERAATSSDLRALVVDDSITMRTMLRNVLRAAGYHVTVAEDGEEALAVLSDMDACHIVITDLQMPRMDGMELCRNIRGRTGAYIPIVMVTSVDDDHEKTRALSAGADAYVVKAAFEQSTFLKRVDTLVRGPV